MLLRIPDAGRAPCYNALSPFASMEPAPRGDGRLRPTLAIQVPNATGRNPPRIARQPSDDFGDLPDGARIGRALRGDLNSIPTVTNVQLQLKEYIGGGSYGEVWRGYWNDTTIPVAVKLVGRYKGGSVLPYTKSGDLQSIEAEWDTCHRLANHDNLVTFHQVVWWHHLEPESPSLRTSNQERLLCFVMEYCAFGSLWTLLRDAAAVHREAQAGVESSASTKGARARTFYKKWIIRLSIAHQIALGLQFMHNHGGHGMVHRDLTSANVLLTQGLAENPEHPGSMTPWIKAKICDYGFTRLLEGNTLCTAEKASYCWQAPEVLDPSNNEVHYSRAADVYSLGVILWEIITLKVPWSEFHPHCRDHRVREVVGQEKRQLDWLDDPAECGPHMHTRQRLQDLATRCWATDPKDRPTMQEVAEELAQIRNEEQAEVLAAGRMSRSARSRQAAG
mmetsp:Transcript_35902/g.101684  ORF Transcript_35902/g.101684 Transcript_35902/m.101684 type:complete len:448 (-) Transcript_35902:299-1642(-)